MKIVVCVKPTASGELNPFEGAAYENALRIPGAEVILLSMAPESAADFLRLQTRLGAREAILLSDVAFAGSDTLATSYILSLALQRLDPDYVFCGRQTLEGDTGQVGIGIATRLKFDFATRVMECSCDGRAISVRTRGGTIKRLLPPSLLTFERICDVRLPSIRSKTGPVRILHAADLCADLQKCGTAGSPTQVKRSFENADGQKKCVFVPPEQAPELLWKLRAQPAQRTMPEKEYGEKLPMIWVYGEKAVPMAKTVGEQVVLKEIADPDRVLSEISEGKPDAVLWESTETGRECAAAVATLLQTGLCADCVLLETDGKELLMTRPAFAGNRMATIVCKTKPAMATIRTESDTPELLISAGAGAADALPALKELAVAAGAGLMGSRKAVDAGLLPYDAQVGLTGRTVAPKVYVAVGISGAVHHLVGIRGAEKVVAINPDRSAPIFRYADYGVLTDADSFVRIMSRVEEPGRGQAGGVRE